MAFGFEIPVHRRSKASGSCCGTIDKATACNAKSYIRVLVQVLVTLFLIQLCADMPEKERKMALVLGLVYSLERPE